MMPSGTPVCTMVSASTSSPNALVWVPLSTLTVAVAMPLQRFDTEPVRRPGGLVPPTAPLDGVTELRLHGVGGTTPQDLLGDDAALDVLAALDCGMQTVWVNRTGHAWTHAAEPHLSVTTLTELCDLLGT